MIFRTWDSLVGPVTVPAGGVHLLLDPDGLDEQPDAVVVTDRWQLRRLLELEVPERVAEAASLLLHLQIADLRTFSDLPFDARSLPRHTIDLRASAAVRQEATKLPRPVLKALLDRGSLRERTARAAHLLTDLAWPVEGGYEVTAAIRLAGLGPALRRTVADTLPAGWLHQTLLAPDPVAVVGQEARTWWEHGSHDQLDHALRTATPELEKLVRSGVLAPPQTPVARSIPASLRQAVARRQDEASLATLVETLNTTASSLDGWIGVANDWATIRRLLSQLPEADVAEWTDRAWSRWKQVDDSWNPWLQKEYGVQLGRSPAHPVSVHQVAPFLARRGGTPAQRIVLLVLDGLGIPQWQLLQQELHFSVLEDRRLLAGLPTLTSISRQAIFAGKTPKDFAATAKTTTHEGKHWTEFWQAQGLRPDQIHYAKTLGGASAEWEPPASGSRVAGYAVGAPDKLLHGAEVLGDRQLSAGIVQWAQAGYVTAAQTWCQTEGAELWITSDHGNLPTTATTFLAKNLTTQRVGHRVAFHSRETFRDQSSQPGLAWTPPGLGAAVETLGHPYFAPDRTAFTAASHTVAHGGLSIDEVIVPLVRIV
ncbi:PglZ domain-containing protein [Nocardioides sp. Soil805]|uniref:PglZ domain-containing protein n=1 Tax=Nocardioides sp. Soil805 TaxID=1736416 RepID=UPI0007032C50|nr:PglZ domain-containing protein [Nocardioides sp. Soil805]KRF37387.1 hypothetical protein ASG94_08680 [Nocardioides sp. Soil805]